MSIRPEISSRTSTLTTPAGAEIPQVNTSFLETSVVVKDGVTVILGGLRRDDHEEKHRGVPYLMDIPVLGNLFKSREESSMKTEILIFLTPKIVEGDENYTGRPLDIKRMPQTPSPRHSLRSEGSMAGARDGGINMRPVRIPSTNRGAV